MDVPECFKHAPLVLTRPSLRLVDILPRQEDGHIRCTVRHELQHSDLHFTAVSYEWGPPLSRLLKIYINDRPFEIRQNLFLFLQSLLTLYPGGYKSLWVDALCIDQENDEERNHQVQQMKHIYGAAYPTFVWLGPAADESDRLFDGLALADLDYELSSGLTSAEEVASLTREQWQKYRDQVLLDRFQLWEACQRLSFRTYWSRTWVLQEILLSQKPILMCGTKMCRWSAWAMIMAISRGAKSAATRGWVPSLWESSAKFICNYWLSRVHGVPETGLISLVSRFKQSECSVKHDKVYGVLGLASDAANFVIDYRCSMEDLYYRLLDWMSPANDLNDAFELSRLLAVTPSFDSLLRLLHPEGTLRDVASLCEYFWDALPQIQAQLLLLYLDKTPGQMSSASETSRRATAQSCGEISMLSELRKEFSIRWAASRPSLLGEFKNSSDKGAAAAIRVSDVSYTTEVLRMGGRFIAKCSCSICCSDTLANARSLDRFNGLKCLRADDTVRPLEETNAVIFYRRDKSTKDSKSTYLATGLSAVRGYENGLLLIHDPVSALEYKDSTHEDGPEPRAVRATIAQSLNLVIHQKLELHDDIWQSENRIDFWSNETISWKDVNKSPPRHLRWKRITTVLKRTGHESNSK